MKKRVGYLLLSGLTVAALLGCATIYAIAESITNNAIVFYTIDDNAYAAVNYNEKEQNSAKNAAKRVLDSGIRLNVSDASADGEIMVCYTRNIYMELDRESLCPVFIFYECDVSERKYGDGELRGKALGFALRNIPRSLRVTETKVILVKDEENVLTYRVLLGERETVVSLRSDTGSVVFYDGQSLFRM